jgi:hypothetical protein
MYINCANSNIFLILQFLLKVIHFSSASADGEDLMNDAFEIFIDIILAEGSLRRDLDLVLLLASEPTLLTTTRLDRLRQVSDLANDHEFQSRS